MRGLGNTNRMTQQINMANQQVIARTVRQIHREEERSARLPIATIV